MNKTTSPLPKIFIWAEQYNLNGDQICACATAEDGTKLAEHWCSTRLWVRHDMGITSSKKHQVYNEHYPNGYKIVDLVDLSSEELDEHKELMAAIDRGEDVASNLGGH